MPSFRTPHRPAHRPRFNLYERSLPVHNKDSNFLPQRPCGVVRGGKSQGWSPSDRSIGDPHLMLELLRRRTEGSAQPALPASSKTSSSGSSSRSPFAPSGGQPTEPGTSTVLAEFVADYNHDRPHRTLGLE